MQVAILGAGVVGLTTAVELQNEINGVDVTVFGDKFYKDTTSYVAAGLFRPGTSFAGPTEELTKKWIVDSYNYWDKIRIRPDAARAGVTELSGYIFSSEHEHLTRHSENSLFARDMFHENAANIGLSNTYVFNVPAQLT